MGRHCRTLRSSSKNAAESRLRGSKEWHHCSVSAPRNPSTLRARSTDPCITQAGASVQYRNSGTSGLQVGTTTIGLVLKNAGIGKLPRRTRRASPKVLIAAEADVRQFKVTSGQFSTRFAGLFLFARDLAEANLDRLLKPWPTSPKIPAPAMIRALLALKLWGIGRPYHVMPHILDRGSAFFAGLNVLPKKSTLTEYSTRMDSVHLRTLMEAWHSIA